MTKKQYIEYPEARNKTVKSMRTIATADYIAIEVEFTDRTEIAVEIKPAVHLEADLRKITAGDGKLLKRYARRLVIANAWREPEA